MTSGIIFYLTIYIEVKNILQKYLVNERIFSPKALKSSEDFYNVIKQNSAINISKFLEGIHNNYSSIIKYNSEESLTSVLNLACLSLEKDYIVSKEQPSGKGYVDFCLFPIDNVQPIIIELKWNKKKILL